MKISCWAQMGVLLYLIQAFAEAFKDAFHVASFLHGDKTSVILLVDPDQEGLVVIVPVRDELDTFLKHLNESSCLHTRVAGYVFHSGFFFSMGDILDSWWQQIFHLSLFLVMCAFSELGKQGKLT